MPYKLSPAGRSTQTYPQLTSMQREAMNFAVRQDNEQLGTTIWAADVAAYYGYPNGQYFRGVLASLHRLGLLRKEGEE